jgi:hypothetical protein
VPVLDIAHTWASQAAGLTAARSARHQRGVASLLELLDAESLAQTARRTALRPCERRTAGALLTFA